MTLAIPDAATEPPGGTRVMQKVLNVTKDYRAYRVPTKSLLNVLESPAAVVRGSATARSPTGHLATTAGTGNSFGSPRRGGPFHAPRILRKHQKISTNVSKRQ